MGVPSADMTTLSHHTLGHVERRRLQAALGIAVLTIVLVVGFLIVGGHTASVPAGTVFERRVDAITDCDALASEWSDHESAFRLTGNVDAQRRADIVHNHELAIGC